MVSRLLLLLVSAFSICHGFLQSPPLSRVNLSNAPVAVFRRSSNFREHSSIRISEDNVSENAFQKNKNQRRRGSKRLIMLAAAVSLCLVGTLISPRAVAASTLDTLSSVTATAAAPTAVTVAPIAPPVVGTLGCHGVLPRKTELLLSVRLLYASLMGSVVGWERSASNHSAGVRTMSLVALGAAAFTVCSSFGFWGFPRVDPSRMASNVASGVGFIGAGVITTHNLRSTSTPKSIVHGLTTAAAIWISAAVGVASGVGLYFIAGTAAISTVSILRFGRVKETWWGQRIMKGNAAVTPKRKSSLEDDSMPHLEKETHDLSTWDEKEVKAPVHDFFVGKNHTTAPLVVSNVTDMLWHEQEGILASSKVKKKGNKNKQDEIQKLEALVKDLRKELVDQNISTMSEERIEQRR